MFFHFIQHRKIFYAISGILAVLSITAIIVFGLNLGIEFTGGSLLEAQYKTEAPSIEQVRDALADFDLGDFVVQKQGLTGIVIKTKKTGENVFSNTIAKLDELGELDQGSLNLQLIGAVIGDELKRKTKIVAIISLIAILIYIAFSFRRVSRPVKSYIYGITSLIALCHDVLIPLGIFAVLGTVYNIEITIPIITAFLTVFGYSINDSVVVFDRVRENLIKSNIASFDGAVDASLNETLKRSLHTSLTTLIALFAIFFFGGTSLKSFSLALILGISAGTYSSIFLATPLLASYLKLKDRKMRKK